MRTITVDLYAVEALPGTPDLSVVLQALVATPLQNRAKVCGKLSIRLEHATYHQVAGKPDYWRLGFTRARDDGWPAIGGPTAPAQDLVLQQNGTLLEETFALLVPTQSKLIVQYCHAGVRTPKIADYLSQATNVGGQGFRLHPFVNKSVLQLYRKKSEVAKMHIMIDKVSNADIKRFEGTKVEDMMKACVESNAKRFEASFSVEIGSKDQSLLGRFVGPISSRIRKRKNHGDKLLLEARENESDRLHPIDLLAATESRHYSESKVLRTQGKRYDATSMFNLLEVAMGEWV